MSTAIAKRIPYGSADFGRMRTLKKLVLVYSGWELVYRAETLL